MSVTTTTTNSTIGDTARDYDVVILGGGPSGASAVSICTWLKKRVCVVDPKGRVWPAPTGAVSKIHRSCGMLHGDPFGKKRVPWAVVEEHFQTTLQRVRGLPLPHEGSVPPRATPDSREAVKSQTRPSSTQVAVSEDRNASASASASALATHKFAALPPNVTVMKGFGRMVDVNTVEVRSAGGIDSRLLQTITTNVVLVASGSVPSHLPGIPFDGRYIFDSDNISTIGRTPHRIVVQGAGIIGIEYAFIMRQLGAEVDVVEFMPTLLPALDIDVHKAIVEQLERTGIKLYLNSILEVLEVPPLPANPSAEFPADRDRPETVRVQVRDRSKQTTKAVPFEIRCDAVLSATGRVGNTAGMNLDGVGCKIDRRYVLPAHILAIRGLVCRDA